MTNPDLIHIEHLYPVAPSSLWSFWTEPARLNAWFGPHITLEPHLDGAFREVWSNAGHEVVTSGKVIRFDPPSQLAWSWSDEDWSSDTELSLRFTAEGSGTRLVLEHSGWQSLAENASGSLRAAHASGWAMHLDNLDRYCSETFGAA